MPLVESPIRTRSALGEQRHKIAQDLLDFPCKRSVCGVAQQEATRDHATIEPAIRIVLTETDSKLNEAARIAKAAEPARWRAASRKACRSRSISNN